MECQRDEKATNSRHRQSTVDFFCLKIRSYLYCDFEHKISFFILSLSVFWKLGNIDSNTCKSKWKNRKKWNSKYVLAISNKKNVCFYVRLYAQMRVWVCLLTWLFVFVVAAVVVVCAMGTVKIENILHLHRTLKSHLHANSLYAVSNIIHN